MLVGAILGWGILSPLAKYQNWAPGPVDDWENGSKGWIVWVSLAIMLADSIINLGWLLIKTLFEFAPGLKSKPRSTHGEGWSLSRLFGSNRHSHAGYSALNPLPGTVSNGTNESDNDSDDAPPSQLISARTVIILLPVTLILNVICMHIAFGNVITPFLSSLATLLALVLSIMGVRALGETDLNPVSGISKLTQLIFALVTPAGQHTRRTAIVTNLLAGAVSEAGALQAGDMMQDLKTGHILGASPKAQFYGQLIGSIFGAVVSTAVYKMYVNVYDVPGQMFQVPTAYVWIFTARLVTGQGLPPMAWQAAMIAGAVFVITTILRIIGAYKRPASSSSSPSWTSFIPGGIAVAVGMFNVPSFTLARAIGGAIAWWWARRVRRHYSTTDANNSPRDEDDDHLHDVPADLAEEAAAAVTEDRDSRDTAATAEDKSSSTVVVLASGLILGEGVISILNLVLASCGVPHL
jgi:OPT family oligopeptide transporter